MHQLGRASIAAAMILAASTLVANARAQPASARGDETLYLTPSIADQRRFGLAQDAASTAHICTDASRTVQVSLISGQPPQMLHVGAALNGGRHRYCELTVTVSGQSGKVLYKDTEDFMAMQGIIDDVTIAVHNFGTRQMLIINNNGISNAPLSSLYIPVITANGVNHNPFIYFTSGERISFAFLDSKFTISGKYFDGAPGDHEPSCCFKEASFDLTLDRRRAKFIAQGDKRGMDLYRQLSANAARKPGTLGLLPSDQAGDTHPSDIRPTIHANALGLRVSDWQTYWIYGMPNQARTAFFCVPAVSFRVTNDSKQDLDAVQISASFLDKAERTTFGSAMQIWSITSGDAPLPPGYSRRVSLHSSRGIMVAPYSCTAASRPTIAVRVLAQSLTTAAQATLGTSQVVSEMRDYRAGQ